MSRNRKTYDKQFKLMSVELSKRRTDLVALAKELDISPALLYRWRKELLEKQEKSFPGNGKTILSEAEQEIARLKKELHDAQLERDILKKLSASSPGAMTNLWVHKGTSNHISH